MRNLTCTVSGSFRRFLCEIAAKIDECRRNDVTVLSPKSTIYAGEVRGFVMLEGDKGTPEELEKGHLQAIERSDFLYVVNPEGYVGPSATLEIGYAVARSVPVYCSEPPQDTVICYFSVVEPDICAISRQLLDAGPPALPIRGDLRRLQEYVRRVVEARGFGDEGLRDVVLLLVEEVGELAKAVRKSVGLKSSSNTHVRQPLISHELADCLIYLLDIANLADVDMDTAFQEKEVANSLRYPNIK